MKELTLNSLLAHSPDKRDDSEKFTEKEYVKMAPQIEEELKNM